MKYLLDTMVWLWSVGSVEKIGAAGQQILEDGDAEIYLSAVSSWEIAIKARLGKYKLPDSPDRYVPRKLDRQGIRSLPVTSNHSLSVFRLPLYHHDPFDHLLMAQAVIEKMTILTSDRIFENYPVEIVWCG
jgi:PIN domain nuclease of toxin-antitoxin system